MNTCSLIRLLLTLVALATVVGHVCAVPGHAHTMPSHDGHDHSDADGSHVASCEALRPAAAPDASALSPVMLPYLVASPGPVSEFSERASDAPAPSSSPPLYLAHRALLI